MRIRLVTGAFVVVATASFGVVAAQHTGQHQSPPHSSRTDHAMCGAHHAVAAQTATQHHAAATTGAAQHHAAAATQHHATTAVAASPAAAMPAELKLSEKQAAEIDRLTTEACAAMAKYHEQILAVLTPELRDLVAASATDCSAPVGSSLTSRAFG